MPWELLLLLELVKSLQGRIEMKDVITGVVLIAPSVINVNL